MKTLISKLFIIVAIAFSVSSCDLHQLPTTAIETENAFKTYDDAVRLSTGLNVSFKTVQYGIYATSTELQGDMFNASIEYGNRGGSLQRMDQSLNSGDYDIRDVWRGLYKAIFNVNIFLANIDKITTTTETQAANIQKFIGNAHFYRASYYHQLIRLYAGAYNESAPGVPLITVFDLTLKPARATMGQIYQLIESDIATARQKLAGVAGVAASITPTIDAVKALDARVNFYKKDYAKAASIASELISNNAYALSSTQEQMTSEWYNDNGKESIMQLHASLSEMPNSNARGYLSYVSGSGTPGKYAPDYIPTKTCIEMYDATDLRLSTWFATQSCKLNSAEYNLVLFEKYKGNPVLETPPGRAYAHKPKVFTISEMYLIRAESLAATSDVAGAKVALNALQTARKATLTDGSMASVRKEWARETIGQGFRLDCFKRWNVGFSGRVPQNNLTVQINENFTGKVAPAGYFYFTWAIPKDDIAVNNNLVQNTGW